MAETVEICEISGISRISEICEICETCEMCEISERSQICEISQIYVETLLNVNYIIPCEGKVSIKKQLFHNFFVEKNIFFQSIFKDAQKLLIYPEMWKLYVFGVCGGWGHTLWLI